MNEEEKYLFDLQGYLVVPRAVPAELLARLNQAIDETEQLSDEEVGRRASPATTSPTTTSTP